MLPILGKKFPIIQREGEKVGTLVLIISNLWSFIANLKDQLLL